MTQSPATVRTENRAVGAGAGAQKQIFISYSHAPDENAAFVRDLAARLRIAGYAVWLDEERIPPGSDFEKEITKAAGVSEAAIFIVTERWVERPWTRHEVSLFGERGSDVRLLVIEREKANTGQLGPYLAKLHRIRWSPGDKEMDARLWQIYCGIERREPGERDKWAENGRNLGSMPPPAPSTPPPSADIAAAPKQPAKTGRIALPMQGMPVDCIVGDDWIFVVSNLDEWVGISANGKLHRPLPRLSNYAACLAGGSSPLVVSMCDPTVARLGPEGWQFGRLSSPALSLCVGPDCDFAGTAAGTVVALRGAMAEVLCQTRDPVIALAAGEGGLLVLGAQGLFGRLPLPAQKNAVLQWLTPGEIGRPLGLFPTAEAALVGVFGKTRIGAIDPATDRLTVCGQSFDEGIDQVVFLGPQRFAYAVLTEMGRLYLVDSSFGTAKPVKLPDGAFVAGCCATPGRSLAASWTRDGRLFEIASPDGAPECLIESGVRFACAVNGPRPGIGVVSWDEGHFAAFDVVVA